MMICVTGTPGVGKTSVSKILSRKLGMEYYSLNDLAEKLKAGFDDKRNSVIIDEEKLREMRIDGVIDGHLSHYCDCDVIVVLRCSNQKEHLRRMETKGWKEGKMKENMEAELMEVVAEEVREIGEELGKRVVEVETSGKTPEQVVEEILNNLSFPEKK